MKPPTAPLFHSHHHHCIEKQPSSNNVCKHTGDSLQSNGSCLFVISKRRKSVGCFLLPTPSPSLGRSHFVPAIYRAPCLQKSQTKCVNLQVGNQYVLMVSIAQRKSTWRFAPNLWWSHTMCKKTHIECVVLIQKS